MLIPAIIASVFAILLLAGSSVVCREMAIADDRDL